MILLACPKCSRQYDVTHLPPQSRVRCVCDEAFQVTWRKPLVIAHLQCANCAGAIEPEDSACRYCNAALPKADRRASCLCPICFARMEEGSSFCAGCGTEIRPQSIQPIPDGRTCPRCESELCIRMLEHDELIECTVCKGAWFSAETFERICGQARRQAHGTPITAGPQRGAVALEEAVSYIPCLACGEIMLRKQYRQDGRSSRVIVDYCRDHGIWLDPTELEQIVTFLRKLESRARNPGESSLGLGAPRQLPKSGREKKPWEKPEGSAAGRVMTEALDILGSIFCGDIFF